MFLFFTSIKPIEMEGHGLNQKERNLKEGGRP